MKILEAICNSVRKQISFEKSDVDARMDKIRKQNHLQNQNIGFLLVEKGKLNFDEYGN